MKFKKISSSEKGFSALNFLFVAGGIALLIYGLLSQKDLLASLAYIFVR